MVKQTIFATLKYLIPAELKSDQKLALKWTYCVFEYILRQLWACPFAWNRRRKQLVVERRNSNPSSASRWEGRSLVKWRVVSIISIIFALGAIVQCLRQLLFSPNGAGDDFWHCFLLIMCFACSTSLCLTIHCLFHVKDISTMFNIATSLLEKLYGEFLFKFQSVLSCISN